MAAPLGQQFAEALGHKDADRLKSLLRRDIDFRAMTPSRFWEADTADAVVDDILLGKWFDSSDEVTGIASLETGVVGRRERVSYRFDVRNPDGAFVVEQQAYYETDGGHISWLRIMCAGYQPSA